MENNSELINSKLKEYCEELKRNYQINNRVLLVKVPSFDLAVFELDVARKRSYYAYPPTGLQYLSSALSKRGLDIRILDLNYEILKRVNSGASFNILEWMQILEKHLGEFKPSIIGVSNLFNSEKSYFIQILEFLKNKQYIVITGGQNATYNGEALIKKELCHFVCKREGENKINYLFDYLYEIKNCPPVPEILFKYKGNLEQTEGERDRVKLAGNLIDTYKLVPIEEYCQAGSLGPFSRMAGKDSPFATIIFNRGCEGNCKFCNVADYMGRGIRSRDAGDVLNEIEYLYKNRNIRHFEFLDDDFTANKSKALEILQGIIDRNLKITWASSNGLIARTLDYEIMKKMRESGCIGFRTGVESGNSEVLKRIGKPGNLEDFKRFSELAQKFPEMFISDNYIFGLPEENFGQILESYKFSLEMNLDWSNYSVYQHSVNYFGNKEERVKELPVEDFIPTKHVLKGKIASHEEVQEGVDVFNIPKSAILST